MKLNEVAGTPLQYGDRVVHVDKDSMYAGQVGKIREINNISASVLFEGAKKPVTIVLSGLQRA